MNEETINKLYREDLTRITVSRGRLIAYFVLFAFSLVSYIDFLESVPSIFIIVRLSSMVPAVLFLVYSFSFYKKYPKIALPFYSIAVVSIILQLGWMVLMSARYPEITGSIYKHSLAAFSTAIFAGVITIWGARKYLFVAYVILLIAINLSFVLILSTEPRMVIILNTATIFSLIYLVLMERADHSRFRNLKLLEVKEKELSQKALELEHVNTELESFNYSISHDLKTPLRNANSFTQLLIKQIEKEDNPKVHEFGGFVTDSLHKMHELIEALLNLSRIGKHKLRKENIDLSVLVKDVLKSLLRGLPKTRQVEFDLGQLPVIEADRTLIRQVIVNLISNALKYTAKKENAVIKIGSEEQNGKIIFFVKDNGAGFDMAYKDKLFKIFQRLHSQIEFEGTGVGLSITQRIIQFHGGKIWAEGKVGKGATFYFTL